MTFTIVSLSINKLKERSNKLKILFIPKWYPSKVHDLNGIFIKKHAVAANVFNDIAILFAVNDPSLKYKWVERQINVEDGVFTVRCYYKNKFTGISFIDKIIKLFLYYISLFQGYSIIIKKWGKPDLTHPHILLRPALFALYLKFVFQINYLIGEHWTGYTPFDGSYKGFFRKLICRIATKHSLAITPDSDDLGYWMRKHHLKADYFVVNNVVDTDVFTVKSNILNDKKSILHISSLDLRQKNVNGIIEAIALVWGKRKDFVLNIIGDDGDLQYYKDKCKTLGLLNTCIFFLGKKYSVELATFLQQADFFILFSNYENNPCVIGESLACGVPVLATDVGGVKEMVADDMGILTPVGDISALADNIIYMLDHYTTYNREKISVGAKNKYSYSAIASRYAEVYTMCTTSRKLQHI